MVLKWRDKESSDWTVVGRTRMGSRHWKTEVLSTMFSLVVCLFSIAISHIKFPMACHDVTAPTVPEKRISNSSIHSKACIDSQNKGQTYANFPFVLGRTHPQDLGFPEIFVVV